MQYHILVQYDNKTTSMLSLFFNLKTRPPTYNESFIVQKDRNIQNFHSLKPYRIRCVEILVFIKQKTLKCSLEFTDVVRN